MRLTILGSGTCIPYRRRGSSSYALELPKSTILLDCGNGATWKLGKVEGHLTPAEVSRITYESGAKKIIVTHLYPVCDESDILVRMRNEMDADVVVAEDLLEISARYAEVSVVK
jgi:ribonuclease BN (tRNA processing enzyme)